MNIPWPRLRRATIPTILALLLALTAAAPGTSRAATGSKGTGTGVEADPLPPISCPCALWAPTDRPASGPDPDTAATELGVKFRVDRTGLLIGIRFWKDVANTGTHTGSLWSETGERLAAITFTDESESGWQQANFHTPRTLDPGVTYVVSYQAPNGRYSADEGGLTAAHTRGPLTAPASADVGGNGVYTTGAGFPNSTWNDANYWVGPVFTDTHDSGPAPQIVDSSPRRDEISVPVDTRITVTFDREVRASGIQWELWQNQSGVVPGTTTYDPVTRTAGFEPTYHLLPGKGYFVHLKDVESIDGTPMPDTRWFFITAEDPSPEPVCRQSCTIWPSTATPAAPAEGDSTGIEVGVKFGANVPGWIQGIRFYKGPGNHGTHVGTIWDPTGRRLTTATFLNETESGWQQAWFVNPVYIAPNFTYTASYYSQTGRYSATPGGLTEAAGDRLLAPKSDHVGGNGVYKHGARGYPTTSGNGTNFWVDVVFIVYG